MSRFRDLGRDQLQAGGAALALLLTMFLPWYREKVLVPRVSSNLSAFEVFTFVEAAVLVVSGAVLYLLWARSQRRAFHLPGGDGWAVTIGGGWVLFLLIWRLFDKPHVGGAGATVGVQWGLFVAMAVAAALLAAGQRMRVAARPEPPNPAEDPTWEVPTRRNRSAARRPADPGAVTQALRERPPAWEGEPREAPGRAPRPTITGDPSEWHTTPLFDDAAPPPPPPAPEPPADGEEPDAPPPGQPRLF